MPADCSHCGFPSPWHEGEYACGRCREVHGIPDMSPAEMRVNLLHLHPEATAGLVRIARCCYANSAPYRDWFDSTYGPPSSDSEYIRPFEIWEDEKGRFRVERHHDDPFQTKSIVHDGAGVFRSLEDADGT